MKVVIQVDLIYIFLSTTNYSPQDKRGRILVATDKGSMARRGNERIILPFILGVYILACLLISSNEPFTFTCRLTPYKCVHWEGTATAIITCTSI